MQQKIKLSPLLGDPFEHLFGLSFGVYIERHEDRRLKRLRQRLDMLLGPFVQIGDSEVRPEGPKRLGTSPCDRLIVGDTDDQSLPALQRNFGFWKYGDCHDALSRFKPEDEFRFHSSDNVCCAIMSSSSVGTI